MAFVPVPNTAEVEIRGLLDSQKVENTLWFEAASGWTTSSLTTLAGEVLAWYIANIIPHLPAPYRLVEVFAKDKSTAAGNEATVTPGSTTVGGGGPAMPNNVTLAISFRTALGGRSFRGRNYMPGIPQSQYTDTNRITSSYLTAVQVAYSKLLDPAVITDAVWVVASRFSGTSPVSGEPTPRPTGIATPVTAALFVDEVTDSQRRRLPGRGT